MKSRTTLAYSNWGVELVKKQIDLNMLMNSDWGEGGNSHYPPRADV